jgi:hypothetical protein
LNHTEIRVYLKHFVEFCTRQMFDKNKHWGCETLQLRTDPATANRSYTGCQLLISMSEEVPLSACPDVVDLHDFPTLAPVYFSCIKHNCQLFVAKKADFFRNS